MQDDNSPLSFLDLPLPHPSSSSSSPYSSLFLQDENSPLSFLIFPFLSFLIPPLPHPPLPHLHLPHSPLPLKTLTTIDHNNRSKKLPSYIPCLLFKKNTSHSFVLTKQPKLQISPLLFSILSKYSLGSIYVNSYNVLA